MTPRVLWSAPEPEEWQEEDRWQRESEQQEQRQIDFVALTIIGVALLVAWWAK
jgi:hypothetical protein